MNLAKRVKVAEPSQVYTKARQAKLPVMDEKKPKVELRDYFIAAALTGLCAGINMGQIHPAMPDVLVKKIAETARRLADEELIERER